VQVVLARPLRYKANRRPTAQKTTGSSLGLIKMEVSSLIVMDDHGAGNVVKTLTVLPNWISKHFYAL